MAFLLIKIDIFFAENKKPCVKAGKYQSNIKILDKV
jgi:hypothetical protein